MASVFAHGLMAIALGRHQPRVWWTGRFWTLSVMCAILPDLDVLGFMAGIPYGDLWGHRGITHSLLFAGLVGVVVVEFAFPSVARWSANWWRLVVHFTLVTASHGVLDAMTDGGLGVAFFAPFDETRYFFPWRPVKVSPIGVNAFFSLTGLGVIVSEVIWIGIPVGLWMLGTMMYRKTRTIHRVLVPTERE